MDRFGSLKVFKSPEDFRQTILERRVRGDSIGYVPTMGALHEGHRHVLTAAGKECDSVVASIFVNPTQFDTDEDAARYPRNTESDLALLEEVRVDYCFQPDHETMYPKGDVTEIRVDHPLIDRYEGEIRPRFFEGVARILSKFFNIIPAHRAYFGEKDLQQYLMIKRMVQDLHFTQTVRPVPVARDENGIAYSSRNEGFTEEDWNTAAEVFRLMKRVKDNTSAFDRSDLSGTLRDELNLVGMDVQYFDTVSLPGYEPCDLSNPSAVLLVAGYVGDVRVKDNLPLHYDSIKTMESEGVLEVIAP